MKSFYTATKLRTDDFIVSEIKKLDDSKIRTKEMWEKRCELVKILKTPYWLR
jgi:hypothetical protein